MFKEASRLRDRTTYNSGGNAMLKDERTKINLLFLGGGALLLCFVFFDWRSGEKWV